MTCLRFTIWGSPVAFDGVEWYALLPSKQLVGITFLRSTVIARQVRVWLDCTGIFCRSNLMEEGNLAKKGFGNEAIMLRMIVLVN